MNYLKERSNFTFQGHSRTPYSRPDTDKYFKAPKRPLSSSTRTSLPEKAHGSRSPYPSPNEYPQSHSSFAFEDDFNDSLFVNENFGPSTSRGTELFQNRVFHPHKSQSEGKTLVPFQELETMSIRSVSDISDVSKRTKLMKTTQETATSDSFQIKLRRSSLRIFSGAIGNLIQWSKLRENFYIMFEVRAILESIQQGKWSSEKILHLTDSKAGPRMQVMYYEIDRPLPPLSVHSVVRCVGRLLDRNRLQAFKVDEISEEERNDSQRLTFICNRVAEELQQKK